MRISRTFITGTRTERLSAGATHRARQRTRVPRDADGPPLPRRRPHVAASRRRGVAASRRHGIRPDAAPAIPATLTAAANAANADTILR